MHQGLQSHLVFFFFNLKQLRKSYDLTKPCDWDAGVFFILHVFLCALSSSRVKQEKALENVPLY